MIRMNGRANKTLKKLTVLYRSLWTLAYHTLCSAFRLVHKSVGTHANRFGPASIYNKDTELHVPLMDAYSELWDFLSRNRGQHEERFTKQIISELGKIKDLFRIDKAEHLLQT